MEAYDAVIVAPARSHVSPGPGPGPGRGTGAPAVATATAARFGERAMRLAGVAAVLARWTPDTFWRATPADLETVLIAIAGDGGDAPPDTATIDTLKGLFPDG